MSTTESPTAAPTTIDGGDHERFKHYAPKRQLTEAMVLGTPVRALCGKTWVPGRDPDRYPLCPDCRRIYDALPDGRNQP